MNIEILDLDNLRHMTGSDSRYKKSEWGFRNRFVCEEEGKDYQSMVRLKESGLIKMAYSDMFKAHSCFATEKGLKAIGFNSQQIKKCLN